MNRRWLMDVTVVMPTEEGWYWWRHSSSVGGLGKWRPVQVYQDGRSGRMVARGVQGGEWGGKLTPPPE